MLSNWRWVWFCHGEMGGVVSPPSLPAIPPPIPALTPPLLLPSILSSSSSLGRRSISLSALVVSLVPPSPPPSLSLPLPLQPYTDRVAGFSLLVPASWMKVSFLSPFKSVFINDYGGLLVPAYLRVCLSGTWMFDCFVRWRRRGRRFCLRRWVGGATTLASSSPLFVSLPSLILELLGLWPTSSSKLRSARSSSSSSSFSSSHPIILFYFILCPKIYLCSRPWLVLCGCQSHWMNLS